MMRNFFKNFAVGDVAVFERKFSIDDFTAFAHLSGDVNLLHHDNAYAQTTQFGRPIVPLHLTLAPLSRIAGMIFPGQPALYINHSVRAILPIYYGETVYYSARIQAINPAYRILTLRVLGLRGIEVILDAEMQVQATADEWSSDSVQPIFHTAAPGRALVTGASGGIGSAIALALAAQGWALLLQDRGDEGRRQPLYAALERLKVDAKFIKADLIDKSGCSALETAIVNHPDVEVIIHTASPELTASLEDLVQVNYSAFKGIISAALPNMLARQKGRVLLVGSTAMVYHLPDWEDYTAAKTMAGGLVMGLNRRFAAYGVHGLLLMPNYVATRYSNEVRGNAPALLPQEVADAAIRMVENPETPVAMLEIGRHVTGDFGFSFVQQPPLTGSSTPYPDISPVSAASVTKSSSVATIAANTVRQILHLPKDADLNGSGIVVTPGWDSLHQIEIILALESRLGIQFTSNELAQLDHFDALVTACQKKVMQL